MPWLHAAPASLITCQLPCFQILAIHIEIHHGFFAVSLKCRAKRLHERWLHKTMPRAVWKAKKEDIRLMKSDTGVARRCCVFVCLVELCCVHSLRCNLLLWLRESGCGMKLVRAIEVCGGLAGVALV